MSLSTRIAPHLPSLRRFARSITGSQTAGDAYVAAILESLIEDVDRFPDARSDRIALFQYFLRHYGRIRVDVGGTNSPYEWEKQAARNLSRLTERPRQAFLLASVESFQPNEIAEILDIGEGAVSELLDDASQEISSQIVTEILIIEDEPLIAMDIEQIVESLGHRVTGIARTYDEAMALYGERKPRMVLADIQLADGSSGIDAVNRILRDVAMPVIFITAFPERLLTGERPEPAFLITKPFNADMVKALISQALFFNQVSETTG
jgi:DNA-directed RNA polymerase specialized sigma24 family protein/CheY-like chemotaxis protein